MFHFLFFDQIYWRCMMKEYISFQTEKKLKISLSLHFFKKDIVFTISLFLALTSCLIHAPKLQYIDFKVLVSLFNLMLAVKAFEEEKLLDKIALVILNRCQNSKMVSTILILLCFFSSMFITNDVALITFVPLTLIIAHKTGLNMIETIILQTIAANLGSSLTPMGNPQNLFIFSHYGITSRQFFSTIVFLAVLGLISILLMIQRMKNKPLNIDLPVIAVANRKKAIIWGIIFCIIVSSIFGFINYKLAFIIVLGTVFLLDKQLLKKIDYLLLITFICFFIFVGNISSIETVRTFTSECLKNPTSLFFSSVFLSQFISNVPATILLAKFSLTWKPLLLGVNIGGLGTIIASLASVISYKLFLKKYPEKSKAYLVKFSLYNFSFLVLLSGIQYLILLVFHLL